MSEKLSKNINLLMKEARLNAEELSRRISIPASTIKKIRSNSDTNPTLSTLLPIAKYFSLTISQLIGDEPFPQARMKGSYLIDPKMLNRIPLISWQQAIYWPCGNYDNHSEVFTEHLYGENSFALKVEEETYENLAKGTALLIDPSLKVEHRDFIIVYKNGQRIPSLKQALFDEGNIYLKPLIQGYNIINLTPEHKILGVVIEYKKHLKN